MTYKDFVENFDEFCEEQESCATCPLNPLDCGPNMKDRDAAERIISDWMRTRRTILQDFRTKHPKAPLNNTGFPMTCALLLGYVEVCKGNCKECWETKW